MSRAGYRLGAQRSPFGKQTEPRWREYSERKNAWILAHPNASAREIDAAAREIAAQLGL